MNKLFQRKAKPEAPTTGEFRLEKAVKHIHQSSEKTCWLACAAMVYGYYGKSLTEKQLADEVSSILGEKAGDTLANERECKIALAGKIGAREKIDQWRRNFLNGASLESEIGLKEILEIEELLRSARNMDTIADALRAKEPAVVVCRLTASPDSPRHALVVTGVKVEPAPGNGRPEISAIEVLDPNSQTGEPTTRSAQDLKLTFEKVFTRSNSLKQFELEERFAQTKRSSTLQRAAPKNSKTQKTIQLNPFK